MIRFIIFSFILFSFSATDVLCQIQHQQGGKNKVLQKAHDRKISKEEFSATQNEQFLVKIYTVDEKAKIGKTHHWFFKLADLNQQPLNYAKIELEGFLKDDPTVKFNYMNPVNPLCSEGKYIIGFVKVQHKGPWVLEASIENFGKTDEITCEITIEQ